MNKYHHGVVQAKVDQTDVHAAWINLQRADKGLNLLNKAFEIYHLAYNAISDVTDAFLNLELMQSLDKAAKSGRNPTSFWGNVHCLEDAFKHLDKNNGCWTDTNTDFYPGGPDTFVGPQFCSVSIVPSCAVSFLKAVDLNQGKLREYLGNCHDGLKELTESADHWEQVGEALKGVEKYSKYVKPLLWLTPKALQEAFDTVVEWDEKIDGIHGKIDTIIAYGTSNHPAEDAVFQGLVAVLQYVPVIGPSYGKIVAQIPSFATSIEAFADGYWARRGMQTWKNSKHMGRMF
jgi:hypothetical protein